MSDSTGQLLVVKIGTSSVTTASGDVDAAAISKLCAEVAAARAEGHRVVIVTSGAIAAGLPALGFTRERPRQSDVLRAAAAVGQIGLFRAFEESLSWHGLTAGQVLLAPTDLMQRRRYLMSRGTMEALLQLGIVPVVNENDAVADDEIQFGDNDRLAALVAHLIEADRLVLLTDTAGLFTADPRKDESAKLINEVHEIEEALESMAGGPASSQSRGGMASKLSAAKIATWSGVVTVIASSDRINVVGDAVSEVPGVGTIFRAKKQRLNARRLWIAFAIPKKGTITIDSGACDALVRKNRSLLPAGIVGSAGSFSRDDAVEVADEAGLVVAKGLSGWDSNDIEDYAGKRTSDLPENLVHEVIHRDQLVLLPT